MSDAVTRVMLATRLDPGVQLNDTYEIDERIASGGMGEIYRGHNIQTGEPVAIKTILPELADQEAIFALFKKEATVLNRLHHDTIVRYYSFSRDPRLSRTYLAMEFVDGVSLADRIKTSPLTPDEVCKLFTGVADGLALAHGAGVVHRDLSPDNIILRDGDVARPKLIDFGIARSANIGEGTVIGGGFAGKFNFVSPEQLGIHGREVDARSDIYSLGLVIAASLRGRPIEMGGSHVEVIEKRTKVPDLSDIDESIRPLIEAMLQPNPDDRPAGAAMVAEWLRALKPEERAVPANGGFSAPTAAPGSNWGTQPGVQRSSVGAQPGTPFASADPTQLLASTSPPPFSPSQPPAGRSESPFGPAVAFPTTPPTGMSGPPLSGTAAPVKQKSGAGRYALAGGLLLLVLSSGAGGAYMAGWIGPAKNGAATDITEPPETLVVKTEPSSTEPAVTEPTAKSPEHDAIGDALEDFAKDDKKTTTPPSVKEPVTTPVTETATGPVTEPLTTPVTGQDTTEPDKVTVAPTGTSNPPPSETSDGPPTETTGPTDPTEQPAVPEEDVKVATAGLTKMVDIGVSWLRQYDGGKCFFVAVTSVSDDSINVKGFGPDVASFEKLYNSFMQTHGIEPELNGHLINEAQCAAAEFLKAVQPGAKDHPELQLAADKLKSADALVATVSNTGDKALDLLLVHGDGLVYNMKSLAEETDAGGKRRFQMNFKEQLVEGELPEMVIAITSPSGLAVPEGKQHARAAALFPKLARQIERLGGNVGVDFAYFQVSP